MLHQRNAKNALQSINVRPFTNTNHKTGSTTEDACGCKAGTFSRFDKKQNTLVCTQCPIGSACIKFNTSVSYMGTEEGYWRSSEDSLTFHSCKALVGTTHCVGGSTKNSTQCREGHGGILCSVCNTGYIKQGLGVCSKCPSMSQTGAGLPVAFGTSILVFSIMILFKLYHAVNVELKPRTTITMPTRKLITDAGRDTKEDEDGEGEDQGKAESTEKDETVDGQDTVEEDPTMTNLIEEKVDEELRNKADGAVDDNANFGQSDTSMRNHSKSITFSMGREIDEVMKRLQDLFKICSGIFLGFKVAPRAPVLTPRNCG